MILIKDILEIAGVVAALLITIYVLSRVQMFAWLHGLDKFLNNKFEKNEQEKKK